MLVSEATLRGGAGEGAAGGGPFLASNFLDALLSWDEKQEKQLILPRRPLVRSFYHILDVNCDNDCTERKRGGDQKESESGKMFGHGFRIRETYIRQIYDRVGQKEALQVVSAHGQTRPARSFSG